MTKSGVYGDRSASHQAEPGKDDRSGGGEERYFHAGDEAGLAHGILDSRYLVRLEPHRAGLGPSDPSATRSPDAKASDEDSKRGGAEHGSDSFQRFHDATIAPSD